MTRLAFILFLALCSVCQATITRVQSASIATNSGTTATLTFSSALTIGNTLIIAMGSSDRSSIGSVTVNSVAQNGSSYSPAVNATGPECAVVWYGRLTASATTAVITLGPSTNSAIAFVGVEYSATNLFIDRTKGNTANSGTLSTGSPATTSNNNELLVGVCVGRGTFSSNQTAWLTSITNSYSSVLQCSTTNNSSNADRAVAFLEKITTSTTSSGSGGTATSTQWAGALVCFFEVLHSKVSGR